MYHNAILRAKTHEGKNPKESIIVKDEKSQDFSSGSQFLPIS